MSLPKVIELDGVQVTDSRRMEAPSVGAVNWSVAQGECWVVGGLQGLGVTAFLETAAGLRPPDSGEVKLFGEALSALHGDSVAAIRRRVGYLFSGNGRLMTPLTVVENITLPLRYHAGISFADAVAEVAPLVEWLGLEPVAGLLPIRLARSMRLRVALARALAVRPELLILDDPIAGLDSGQIRWWRQLVESVIKGHPWLHGRPATVVVGTEVLRPFLPVGNCFAMIHQVSMHCLGDREAVLSSEDPGVREVLGEPL